MAEQVDINLKVNGSATAVKNIKNTEGAINSLNRTTNESAKSINSSWNSIGATGVAASGKIANAAIVAGTAVAALQSATKLDALKTRLEVVEGSADAANKRFEQLNRTANSLGINFNVLLDSYTKFKASADGGTLSQEQLNDVFFKFTRATAAMKLSALDTERVFRSLYQMASKGVVSMEELKNQLGDSLPKAMPLAAKAMNVTTQELIKMVENGEVLAGDLLPKLADAYENEFGKKVSIASQSVTADLNRVVNAFVGVKEAVLGFLSATGILTLFEKVSQGASLLAITLSQVSSRMMDLFNGTKGVSELTKDLSKKMIKAFKDFTGVSLLTWNKFLLESRISLEEWRLRVFGNIEAGFVSVVGKLKVSWLEFKSFLTESDLTKEIGEAQSKTIADIGKASVASSAHLVMLKEKLYDINKTMLDFAQQDFAPLSPEKLFGLSGSELEDEITRINDLMQVMADEGLLEVDSAKAKQLTADIMEYYEELAFFMETVGSNAEKSEDLMGSFGEGIKSYGNEMKDHFSMMKDAGKEAMEGLTDTIMEFVTTGKASFKDFATSVIQELIRIQVMQGVVRPLSGFLSNLFHTGTAEVKHTGGYIGRVPSHHSGSLRSDERIAKLQVGEAVVNRAGATKNREAISAMNRGEQVGGGQTNITHNHTWEVTTPDAGTFVQQLAQNKQTILGIVQQDVVTNGSTRTVLKQAL